MLKSSIARVTIAGLVMLSVGACHHKGGDKHHEKDVAKTTEDAKAVIAGVVAAYNAHDAAKAASYDAPDYASMFHGAPNAVGPAGDEASMKEQFKDPAVKFDATVNTVDVAKSGEMAVVRSTYVFHFTDPKTKTVTSETGNWVGGLKRQEDGSLKLVWSIGADTPKPTPVAAAPKS